MATAFEFDVTRDASVVARRWSGRARDYGERGYRMMNNCEHFCSWALRDVCRSRQVARLRGTPRALYRAICI